MILEIYDIERKNWMAILADQIRSINVRPSRSDSDKLTYRLVVGLKGGSLGGDDMVFTVAETENKAREVYENAHDALVETCQWIQEKQKNRRDLKCLSDEEIQRIMNPALPTMIPGDDRGSDPVDGGKSDNLLKRLENDFTYHSPDQKSIDSMKYIRDKAHELARMIACYVPCGREQATALTRLEESVMHANAGIARGQ